MAMTHRYYRLPLPLGNITRQVEPASATLEFSIAQHLHLMATTFLGESKYDPGFGCSVWEVDFDNNNTNDALRESLKESFTYAIQRYEPRITEISLSIDIQQSELTVLAQQVKKKVTIAVKGKLVATNEPFDYYEFFYIGPLSYF